MAVEHAGLAHTTVIRCAIHGVRKHDLAAGRCRSIDRVDQGEGLAFVLGIVVVASIDYRRIKIEVESDDLRIRRAEFVDKGGQVIPFDRHAACQAAFPVFVVADLQQCDVDRGRRAAALVIPFTTIAIFYF